MSADHTQDVSDVIAKVQAVAANLKKSDLLLAFAAFGGVIAVGALYAWTTRQCSPAELARKAKEESRRHPIEADKSDSDVKVLLKLDMLEAETGCVKQVSFNSCVHGSWLRRNATLQIPAATRDGTIIRLSGLGNTPLRGEQGDLVLEIVVEE